MVIGSCPQNKLHEKGVFFRRTPHAVIVTTRDKEDYIRVLYYSYYTTITGWGVLQRYGVNRQVIEAVVRTSSFLAVLGLLRGLCKYRGGRTLGRNAGARTHWATGG